ILFIVEVAFFHGGMIASALISGLFIYAGWKYYDELWGKIMFWLGAIGLLFSILNMLAVRFFIIAAIIIFMINYSKSKKEAASIKPHLPGHQDVIVDPVIDVEPLFDHKIFDDQKTADVAYQWRDVNIHGMFGDRIIDLSHTVLTDDTAVISIRHIVGNIVIYVPYEVGVRIHHSSVYGLANILRKHNRVFIN